MSDNLDDMTELTDAEFDRVDLVGKAANGHKFFFAKSGEGLIPADMVRDLIKTAQEGSMTEPDAPEVVEKDADEILEDPTPSADGDPNEPGSPAWESVDASTAWDVLSELSDVKRALECLSDREGQEAFAGDDDGYDNSWDLSVASDLIDQAIAIIAPYAVGEQDESEQSVEKGELDVRAILTSFVEVTKAGRALSAANETALRGAAAAINNVLATLPPVDDVTKADEVTEPEATEDEVTKAKGDPQMLVYDANGKVLGSIDATDLTTFSNSSDPDASPDDAPADDAAPASEETDKVGTPADAPAPAAPAEAATETAPADDGAVTKSQEADVVKAALEENQKVIKALEDRIAHLEAPAPSRVLANGALPPAHLLRGQDAGAPAQYDGEALRKQLAEAPDAVTKEAIAEQMRLGALEALSELRQNS